MFLRLLFLCSFLFSVHHVLSIPEFDFPIPEFSIFACENQPHSWQEESTSDAQSHSWQATQQFMQNYVSSTIRELGRSRITPYILFVYASQTWSADQFGYYFNPYL